MTRRAFGTAVFSLALSAAAVAALFATRPDRSGDDAVRVACWLLAVACAGWLAITMLAYAAAIARADLAAALRATRLAPPLLRRVLRTTLAGALAVAPVTSDSVPHPPIRLHAGADGRLEPGRSRIASTKTATTSTTTTTVPAPPTPPARARAPRSRRAVAVAREHFRVVRPGDNLWALARAEVARASGVDQPSDRAVAPYWQRVVAINRATLRSGDPSLIFPGEIVTLPNP